jgi:very-short-patch-repair endonuclease
MESSLRICALSKMGGDRTLESPLPLREGARGRGKATLRSRALRKQSTVAEKLLWQKLRRKQFHGLRFRRQFPLGPFFGDFVCLPARLVIEVDGGQHAESPHAEHDSRRSEWLRNQNFRMLRFWNIDIFENLDGVLDRIDFVMREDPLPHPPSRKGRG